MTRTRKGLLTAAATAAAAGALGVLSLTTGGCGADVCIGDSWQAKYAAAAPGEVLTVEAGTHQAQAFSRIAKSGPSVIFEPADGKVTVQGGISSGISGGSVTAPTGAEHIELRDITVDGEVALKWGSNDWVLDNINAQNLRITSSSDVQVLGGDYGPYVNQVVTINSAGGSAPGVFNILIDGAYIHDYTINDPAKHAECMQIWPSAQSSGITIRNTTFRNCTDFGVLVKAPKLTDMVFDTVSLDEPMPGSVATVDCNPNCARGGSSIRFSSYAYVGAKVLNSRMAGGLAIDVTGYVTVTNTCSKCDPGGTQPPPPPPTTTSPPACPGSSLPLRVVAQDATTITFGWDPVSGATGYRFSRSDQTKRPHTWDGPRSSVKFSKGAACYRVEALGVIADGGSAG